MTKTGKFLDWTFNGREMVASVVTSVTLTCGVLLWSFESFQTKVDAQALSESMRREVATSLTGLEGQVKTIQTELTAFRSDSKSLVSDMAYIKGMLAGEQKSKRQ